MNTIKSKLVGEDFMPFRSLIWFDSNGARYDTMTKFDGVNHPTLTDEEIEANRLDREDTMRLLEGG